MMMCVPPVETSTGQSNMTLQQPATPQSGTSCQQLVPECKQMAPESTAPEQHRAVEDGMPRSRTCTSPHDTLSSTASPPPGNGMPYRVVMLDGGASRERMAVEDSMACEGMAVRDEGTLTSPLSRLPDVLVAKVMSYVSEEADAFGVLHSAQLESTFSAPAFWGAGGGGLCCCPVLRLVCRRWRRLHDESIRQWRSSTGLLRFADGPLNHQRLQVLSRLPNLEFLSLGSYLELRAVTQLVSKLRHLSHLHLTQEVDFAGDDVGRLLLAIGTCLTRLTLPLNCTSRASPNLLALLKRLRNLREVHSLGWLQCDENLCRLTVLAGKLVSLQVVSDCCAKGVSVDGLRALTSFSRLQRLTVSYLSEDALPVVPQLTSLTALRLVHCQDLHRASFTVLTTLTGLREMHLECVPIGNRDLRSVLGHLSDLQILTLYNTHVTYAGVASIQVLRNLHILRLSHVYRNRNMAFEQSLRAVPVLGLHNLQLLSLSHIHITSHEWYRIAALTTLRDLSVLSIASDDMLMCLHPLTGLTRLEMLGAVNGVTDLGLWWVAGLTNLQELAIASHNRFTDQGLRHLQLLTNLRQLHCSLNGCSLHDLHHLSNLRGLTVLSRETIHTVDLHSLNGMYNLRHVDLSGCLGMMADVAHKALAPLMQRGATVEV